MLVGENEKKLKKDISAGNEMEYDFAKRGAHIEDDFSNETRKYK